MHKNYHFLSFPFKSPSQFAEEKKTDTQSWKFMFFFLRLQDAFYILYHETGIIFITLNSFSPLFKNKKNITRVFFLLFFFFKYGKNGNNG